MKLNPLSCGKFGLFYLVKPEADERAHHPRSPIIACNGRGRVNFAHCDLPTCKKKKVRPINATRKATPCWLNT